MLNQKFNIIPDIQDPVPNSPKPLVFWRKIIKNHENELHLFLLLEGRTDAETRNLGKEFWEMISAYENEVAINQNGLNNPEYVCEAILRIGNEYLTNFGHRTQIDNWSDLGILIAVASPTALFFARIGRPRLILFRNNQIILADENLSHPRSPQFSAPFSEIAGGPIMKGDRILLVSGAVTDSFSWEEISSLAAPANIIQAYHNLIKSVEVLNPPRNTALLLGDVVPIDREENVIPPATKENLKESRVGELYFLEYNSISHPHISEQATFVPWKEILNVLGDKIVNFAKVLGRVIAIPLGPLSRKVSSLSSTRKAILAAFLIIILAFVILLSRSLLHQPVPDSAPQADYKALYDKASMLKSEAENALIYQDEEKARRNLAEANSLLTEVSQSGEWGIKGLKLKQEVDGQLATLDKAQSAQISEIWSTPDNQESIKGIGFQNNGNILLITDKKGWDIKPDGGESVAQSFSEGQNIGNGWLITTNTDRLFLSPRDKIFYVINAATKNISEKKELAQEVNNSSSATASYNSFVYFFDPDEAQIKQLNYANGGLVFKSDWLKQDMKEEFQGNPAISMSIDGSIYLVTRKGNMLRLSGGKKTSWNTEKPGTPFQGDNLIIRTKPEDKDLYLLDPNNKRIVIFEKESGKLKGQVQNNNLSKAIDFLVDEKGKNVYFVTQNELFKLTFTQ